MQSKQKRGTSKGLGFGYRGEDESVIGGLTKMWNTELETLTFLLHFGTHNYVTDFTLPVRDPPHWLVSYYENKPAKISLVSYFSSCSTIVDDATSDKQVRHSVV